MQIKALKKQLHLRGYRRWILLAVLAYAALGFLLAPLIVHQQLESRASRALGHPVRLGSVSVNPFALSLTVTDARVDLDDQPDAAGFAEFYVNFEVSSLWRRAWTFAEFRLLEPRLDFLRTPSGNTLAELAPEADAAAPASDPWRLPRIIFRDFRVTGSRIDIRDDTRPGGFKTSIDPLNLVFEDLSTVPELSASNRFVAETGSGGRLVWTGSHSVRPFSATGRIEYSENLKVLWRYFRHRLDFELGDGRANLAFDYAADFADEPSVVLSNLEFGVTDFAALAPDEQPFLTVPSLRVTDAALEWPAKKVTIGLFAATGVAVRAALAESGELDIADYLTPAPAPGTDGQAEAADPDPVRELPWSVAVAAFELRDGRLRFDDRSSEPPFTAELTAIELGATGLSLAEGAAAALTAGFELASGGRVGADGELTLVPFALDLGITATGVALPVAQPYVARAARLVVESGTAAADGRLTLGPDAGPAYRGSVLVETLSTQDTLTGEKFFAVDRFEAEGLDIATRPASLRADRFTLSAPFGRIFIAADGTTNIGAVFRRATDDSEGRDAETAGQDTFEITIGHTLIEAGIANFTDLSLPIPFSTGIFELGGSVGAIGTGDVAPAEVSLEGRVDEFGSVAVDGRLDVFAPSSTSDLEVRFRNVSMPRLSPYTAKFAGRKIAAGTLDLDLDYRVRDGRLEASNDIVIDQLELGERVESPDALDVPLRLAVALLKDAQGRITVDIPVSGDLGNPQFSIGGTIRQAIGNLLVGVATAPFQILARLVGGSPDELDHVLFAPGSARLGPPEEQTLTRLADAMRERPELVLEITGTWGPARDRRALRLLALEEALAREVEALSENPDIPIATRRFRALENLFTVRFSPLRLEELEAAYTREVTDESGASRREVDATGYFGAIRAQLEDTFEIGDQVLENLARERIDAISGFLVDDRRIDGGRVRAAGIRAAREREGDRISVPFSLDAAP
ncbi:MAG: DUF748 domain-containing protein [Woeseiaceae bacterium]|nr:DUF748 domain-containing protein [Woeseiaceae bacterium]